MYDILHGLRIVELSSFVAAPSCGLQLLQYGADVIRVDPIRGAPDGRRWPLAEGTSLYWEGLNKGKKSVAIDLSSQEGREIALALITAPGPDAGIFLTNTPSMGAFSHDALTSSRKDLITIRIAGWADGKPAMDYTVNAAFGLPLITGPEGDDAPVNHVLPAWDLLAGSYAATSLLAADRRRRHTGNGVEIRIPLGDIAITTLANLGQVAEVTLGPERARYGNALFGAFGRDFVTADGVRVMIVAITPRQWSSLVESLNLQHEVGALEASLGVSFAKDEGVRFEHRDTLFPLIEAAVSGRKMDDIRETFDFNTVCWSEYRTLKSAIEEDFSLSAEYDLFASIQHPSGYTYPTPGAPARIPELNRTRPVPAPAFGSHTDEVLAEVLGLPAFRIGQLHDKKIVRGAMEK